MKENINRRVIDEAKHILNTRDTIRKTAEKFNVSKSTVHIDLSERLKKIDNRLSNSINEIFQDHDKTKHLRGGQVTKEKYKRG